MSHWQVILEQELQTGYSGIRAFNVGGMINDSATLSHVDSYRVAPRVSN